MNEKKQEQLEQLKKWLLSHYGKPCVKIFIIETNDDLNLSDKELKMTCKKYARINFQGKKFYNSSVDREILVSSNGIGKWDNITKSREQSLSIKKLDELLKNAIKTGSYDDEKERYTVDGFTYFEQLIYINKKPYIAMIATKETHGIESKNYYHFLKEMTDEKNKPN